MRRGFMKTLFRYNWKIRDEWFDWCEQVSKEELLRKRVGGVGGILHTLFHIVDVEYSWINLLQGKPEFNDPFTDFQSLEKVRSLSEAFHIEVTDFLNKWSDEMENYTISETRENGQIMTFTYGEILRHMIAHEIHHVGQLSVWARELDLRPVSANLIGKGLV